MVPTDSHFARSLHATLLGGALLLLGAAVALADPTDSEEMPEVNAVSQTTPVLEIENAFPWLTIESIPMEESPVSVDSVEIEQPPAEPMAPTIPSVEKPVDHAGILSSSRQFALGMIETGNKDSAVGGLGEVSRYQIMPSVWKAYSESRSYQDTNTATEVARLHWTSLYQYFKKKTERDPTNFDMYVLWNTRHGYYAAKGFDPARLHPVVRDRAQRFTNLVEDSQRREAEPEMAALR